MASSTELSNHTDLQRQSAGWPHATLAVCFFTAFIGALYCYLFGWPLWHTDLWGHLAYGRLILETGAIPETEPFMPLSAGVPLVDTAWLSQVIGYGVYASLGSSGLHFLFAATICTALALLAWRFYRASSSVWISTLGLALFLGVYWQHLAIIRPQLAGTVCQVVLLVLLTSRRSSIGSSILVPLLLACWANLHGSFAVGLAMIGAYAVGRAIDVGLRTRSAAGVLRDREAQRLLALTVLAAAAVLLNPYGWRLYREVWAAASHDNLTSLVEWAPLTLRMRQGRAFALAAMAIMVVYRWSPRRVSSTELLQLLGLGLATLWTSRMIVWWAPVAAYYFVVHAAAIRRSLWHRAYPTTNVSFRRSPGWLIAPAVIAIGCLAFPWLTSAASSENLSPETPTRATDYLVGHPPAGQVFNSYEWGDYLIWAGPPGMRVFVASHAHLIPRDVWRDYLSVINLGDGWDEALDRYGVTTVVVDTDQRAELIAKLREHRQWRIAYEDAQAVIFTRAHARAAAVP